jgi:hypothetical protein
MKSIIRLISQVLTAVFIGVLLASLRQRHKVYYVVISVVLKVLFSIGIGVFLSIVFDDSTAVSFSREIKKHWYWYLVSALLVFYLFEKVVVYIQIQLFEDGSLLAISVKDYFFGVGACLALFTVFSFLGETFSVLPIMAIVFYGVYLAVRPNEEHKFKNDISKLVFEKIEGFAEKTIEERESILKDKVYSDPDFRAFATKYNMTEDEFVSKVASYNSKDSGAYAKLLKYDVAKTRWGKFYK